MESYVGHAYINHSTNKAKYFHFNRKVMNENICEDFWGIMGHVNGTVLYPWYSNYKTWWTVMDIIEVNYLDLRVPVG